MKISSAHFSFTYVLVFTALNSKPCHSYTSIKAWGRYVDLQWASVVCNIEGTHSPQLCNVQQNFTWCENQSQLYSCWVCWTWIRLLTLTATLPETQLYIEPVFLCCFQIECIHTKVIFICSKPEQRQYQTKSVAANLTLQPPNTKNK